MEEPEGRISGDPEVTREGKLNDKKKKKKTLKGAVGAAPGEWSAPSTTLLCQTCVISL